MSLLSHSLVPPLPACFTGMFSSRTLFTLRFFYGKATHCMIVCENDTKPTDPKAVQKRKLIMSVTAACSKGITGKELMSFFSYFQALQQKTSRILTWPNKCLFDGAGNGQSSRIQMESKCSSICIPGIIVLDLHCRQRGLRTIWSYMLLLRY